MNKWPWVLSSIFVMKVPEISSAFLSLLLSNPSTSNLLIQQLVGIHLPKRPVRRLKRAIRASLISLWVAMPLEFASQSPAYCFLDTNGHERWAFQAKVGCWLSIKVHDCSCSVSRWLPMSCIRASNFYCKVSSFAWLTPGCCYWHMDGRTCWLCQVKMMIDTVFGSKWPMQWGVLCLLLLVIMIVITRSFG